MPSATPKERKKKSFSHAEDRNHRLSSVIVKKSQGPEREGKNHSSSSKEEEGMSVGKPRAGGVYPGGGIRALLHREKSSAALTSAWKSTVGEKGFFKEEKKGKVSSFSLRESKRKRTLFSIFGGEGKKKAPTWASRQKKKTEKGRRGKRAPTSILPSEKRGDSRFSLHHLRKGHV